MADDLTFIDLFAGCGGLAQGFLDIKGGFLPVGAVEMDADAAETYRLNIDDNIFVRDINGIPDEDWPEARLVVGGPPCQGFSQLGRRDPKDPRNKLWRRYAQVLEASGADVFVMENVPQLRRSDQFALFLKLVAKLGFEVTHDVLNAADFGVPENRRRAIVIGSRLGVPKLPDETHGPADSGLHPYVDVKTAFKGLTRKPNGRLWHDGRAGIRPDSIIRYQAVPKDGGNRFDMQKNLEAQGLGHLVPECWRNKPTGTTDVFGRMWWKRPAPTIRTEFYKPEKGRYLHPVEDRPITVREAARLQSFEDTFIFPAHQPMTSVARQIGNAVPPVLAKAIAGAVVEHFRQHDVRPAVVVELTGKSRRQRERIPA